MVELVSYQMKGVTRIQFDQWKMNQAEGAQLLSWAYFEDAVLWRFFPRELRKEKVQDLLTLKQDCLSVHEYSLKFTQLYPYALERVDDMRSMMSLFIAGFSRISSKEGKAAMLKEIQR